MSFVTYVNDFIEVDKPNYVRVLVTSISDLWSLNETLKPNTENLFFYIFFSAERESLKKPFSYSLILSAVFNVSNLLFC